MNKKFTSTVAGASILLTGVGLMSRGLGLIREVVFAGSFGLGEQFDIYLVGAAIPMTIDVIILFLIQNYLIPAYNHLIEESPDQKETFIRSNFWIFGFGGIALAAILYFCSGFIITAYLPGASTAKLEEARLIFNIFLLIIPFGSASSVLISFLQSDYNFLLPAIGRLSINLVIILTVFFLSPFLGILIIPIGYLAGVITQFIILLYKFDVKLFSPFNKMIVRRHLMNSLNHNLLLIIIIESISQLYTISDRYFSSSVQVGGIAALNYAQTLFALPILTISLALSTAIFPKFSRNYSSGSMGELEQQFISAVRVNIIIFTPIMFAFFFNGNEIIKIIFQRGKFVSSDSLMTAQVLKYLSLSLIFYSIYSVLNKIMYSARWIKALLVITVIGILIKIVLNFILVDTLKQDGLALSSSVSYSFFFLASFYLISIRLSFSFHKQFVAEIFIHFLCALISYIIVYFLWGFAEQNSTMLSLIALAVFCLIYLLNLWIIKTKSMKIVFDLASTLKNHSSI